MKIIFLDIDGVLNTQDYFIKNHENIVRFYAMYSDEEYKNSLRLHVDRILMDIDIDKLMILKRITDETGAKIVVISAWKSFRTFDLVVQRLRDVGIPIIGKTDDNGSDRGYGIYKYLMTHNVSNYIILDDEIFADYDENLLGHLVKTSFYGDGLTEEHAVKIMKKIK